MRTAQKIAVFTAALLLLLKAGLCHAQDPWKNTIEEVKSSVLMIEKESLANLENEPAGCYQATGFIVDAQRGLILTNRHVIGTAPQTARATFWNKEKIPIQPIYYDPMHDFGIYRFDTKALRWAKPRAIKLGDSDKVKVGEEIRVLGNNAAEGFSILEGTVSWVKKNAPTYSDQDGYREFNTYYFQTSANVSGGSSGGPIINVRGEVVAINSSSINYTTVSWGLPINAVKSALASIQGEKEIRRGDIGARVIFSTFDELIDYGFPKKTIEMLKKGNSEIEGLLMIVETLPETDANRYLKPGDVIWQVNGVRILDSFQAYEAILNSSIGKKAKFRIVRDGQTQDYSVGVLNLEKAKINSFVRVGRDHFSNIPLFLAMTYNIPLKGVFTPSIQFSFSERKDFPQSVVISRIGSSDVLNIEDLYGKLKGIRSGEPVKLRYMVIKEDLREEEKVFEANWKWFSPEYFRFNGKKYEWERIEK